jgi:hypothetical protein
MLTFSIHYNLPYPGFVNNTTQPKTLQSTTNSTSRTTNTTCLVNHTLQSKHTTINHTIHHIPYTIYHTNHIIFRLHKCFFPGLYFTLLTPRIHMLFILPSSHIFYSYSYFYLYFFLWQTPKIHPSIHPSIHPPTEFVHVHEHLTARLPSFLRLVFNSIQSVICSGSGLI